MDKEGIKKILEMYSDAIYGSEIDKILDLWTADGVLSSPATHVINGKNAIEEYYNAQFTYLKSLCRWALCFSPECYFLNCHSAIVNGTIEDTSETFFGGILQENIIIPGKFMMLYEKDKESNWKIKQFNWNYDRYQKIKRIK